MSSSRDKKRIDTDMQQISPHDVDVEECVLATIMRYNEVYNEYCDLLSPDLFYYEREREMFRVVDGVLKAGKMSDINTLYAYSQSLGIKDEILSRYSFVEIFQKSSRETFYSDVMRLRELYKRRTAWRVLQLAAHKLYDLTEDVDESIEGAVTALGELGTSTSMEGVYSFGDALNELRTIVSDNRAGKLNFLRTGFNLFDRYYLLRPNTMTVIAAFTSVGKSALALNIAINVARAGIPVGYYSLEMGKSELAARGISGTAGLKAGEILNRQLQGTEISMFENAAKQYDSLPIYIDERSTVAFDKTIRSIRTMRKKKGIGLAIIDYLQIYTQVGDSTEASLAYMARASKNIAKELGIPVILLSQLSRGAAHPSIKMLRGSGQIEESADNIVLIDRPEAYPNNEVQKYEGEYANAETHNTALFILAKGRGVGTGTALVGFDGRYTQFFEREDAEYKEQFEQQAPPIEARPMGAEVPF